jgi:hypothetical protein
MSTWGWVDQGVRALEFPAGRDGAVDVGVSPVGRARLRYDAIADELQVSLSGAPYVTIAGAGGASGWTDDGTVVRLTTSTDVVSVGINVPPADQKFYVTYQPTTGPGSVVRANLIGEAFGGIQGASAYRATRTRTAASGDAWYACYAAEPQDFAGDVGTEIAFHAKPFVPATGGAVAFQAESNPGSTAYLITLQAYEQNLIIRSLSFSTGAGKETRVIASDAGGPGAFAGGDVTLEPGDGVGGGAQGSANLGVVGCRLGAYGKVGITKPTVTGAKGGNAALTSLIAALADATGIGFIVDGTT